MRKSQTWLKVTIILLLAFSLAAQPLEDRCQYAADSITGLFTYLAACFGDNGMDARLNNILSPALYTWLKEESLATVEANVVNTKNNQIEYRCYFYQIGYGAQSHLLFKDLTSLRADIRCAKAEFEGLGKIKHCRISVVISFSNSKQRTPMPGFGPVDDNYPTLVPGAAERVKPFLCMNCGGITVHARTVGMAVPKN